MREFQCDGCGKKIKKKQRYCLRVELFASPEVELDEEEIWQDHRKKLKELYEQMEKEDPKKLEEEVFVAYNLSLCKTCRDKFSKRIKYKEFV